MDTSTTDKKITLDQFGATIRYKYPDYAKYSNQEVAQAILAKYPQYASSISDIPQVKGESTLRKVGDFLTYNTQKFGNTIGQTIAAQSVIPQLSNAEQNASQVELNLTKRIAEDKAMGKDTTRLERSLSDLKGRNTIQQNVQDIVPAVNKSNKQVLGEALGTGIEALGGGELKGISGTLTDVAKTAELARAEKASYLAKPLLGRLGSIAKDVGKGVAVSLPYGYAYDLAQHLQEDKSGASLFKPGAATIVSAAIPIGIGAVRAGKQTLAEGLSKVVAPNLSGVPSGAYDRLKTGASDLIGKTTPESALNDARAAASAFKSTMQREFGEGQDKLIAQFTGKRIGIPESTANTLTKIADRFGFADRLPTNLQNLSAKETMDLLAEINNVGPITQIDDPLIKSFKLGLRDIKDEIMSKAGSTFSSAMDANGPSEFSKLYQDYSAKSNMLKNFQSILGKVGVTPESIKLTPVQQKTAQTRLQRLFDSNSDAYLRAMQALEDETGVRILDKVAASQLSPILPKTLRGGPTGLIGLGSDILGLLTFPISSPRAGSFLIRHIGGYGDSFVTKLLNASPSIREAIYNAVTKENMSFDDAVKLYGKSIIEEAKNLPNKEGGFIANPLGEIPKKKDSFTPKQLEIYNGEKNLTTKTLEKLKGRSVVSKQFISDLTNSPDIKQSEKDLFRKVLADYPEGNIPVKDFANKVKSELLPLTTVKQVGKGSGKEYYPKQWENVVLPDELRGPIADYREHVYESPIKTSAGGVHGYESTAPNYFAHTRIEDLPSVDNATFAGPRPNAEPTRRVIELQSDLFQKGRLESEKGGAFASERIKNPDLKPEDREAFYAKRDAELAKLEPYRNTWHERIIREEVKQAAKDGKTKLQFPTGETAMKIEGLGEGNRNPWRSAFGDRLKPEDLKVGQSIENGMGADAKWIITDVLGDGKFKAVPKSDKYEVAGAGGFDKWLEQQKRFGREETFDISGKVDTNNPIYRFYEKEVGRYLQNKYGAKLVTDPQGVKWWQVDVPKAVKKLPIEAFAVAPLLVGAKKKGESKK